MMMIMMMVMMIIDDFSRGINENNIQATFNKLKSEFACVVQSSEVKNPIEFELVEVMTTC